MLAKLKRNLSESGLADQPTGKLACTRLAAAPDDDAVDDDHVHSGRLRLRSVVGRALGDPARPDHADVGRQARRQPPPVAQAVHVGGIRRQVPGQPLVPGISAVLQVIRCQPRERAVPPRMRVLTLVDPIRPGTVPVISGHPGQVLLSQSGPVQMRSDIEPGAHQQVEHPLPRRPGAARRRLRDRLPREPGKLGRQAPAPAPRPATQQATATPPGSCWTCDTDTCRTSRPRPQRQPTPAPPRCPRTCPTGDWHAPVPRPPARPRLAPPARHRPPARTRADAKRTAAPPRPAARPSRRSRPRCRTGSAGSPARSTTRPRRRPVRSPPPAAPPPAPRLPAARPPSRRRYAGLSPATPVRRRSESAGQTPPPGTRPRSGPAPAPAPRSPARSTG